MASFLFVNPNAIESIADEKIGELKTLRLNCTELAPRTFNVNLMKQPAHIRNQLQQFVNAKQPIMLPIKEGKTSDGQAYFQLEAGQIIPVSLDYVKSLQTPVSDLSSPEPLATQAAPTESLGAFAGAKLVK